MGRVWGLVWIQPFGECDDGGDIFSCVLLCGGKNSVRVGQTFVGRVRKTRVTPSNREEENSLALLTPF